MACVLAAAASSGPYKNDVRGQAAWREAGDACADSGGRLAHLEELDVVGINHALNLRPNSAAHATLWIAADAAALEAWSGRWGNRSAPAQLCVERSADDGCPAVSFDRDSRALCFTRAPCHEPHAAVCALPQGALPSTRSMLYATGRVSCVVGCLYFWGCLYFL